VPLKAEALQIWPQETPADLKGKRVGVQSMGGGLYDRKIYPNIDGLKNVVRLLAGSSEPLRKLKVESIVDDRIVRKLEKEGLF
jgi:hypothetical protein